MARNAGEFFLILQDNVCRIAQTADFNNFTELEFHNRGLALLGTILGVRKFIDDLAK